MTIRRVVFLLVATAAAACGIALWRTQSVQAESNGTLQITPERIVIQAQKELSVTSELTLRNVGQNDIQILGVQTKCGCTMPEPLTVDRLHPGEETRLTLKLVPPGIGVKQTKLSILTDRSDQPQIDVPIEMHGRKASVPVIVQQPPDIRGTVTEGREFHTTIEVETHEAPGDPWLLGFDCDSERVSIGEPTVDRMLEAGETMIVRDYSAEISVQAPSTAGEKLVVWLKPRTASKSSRKVLPIRMVVEWQSALEVHPSALLVSRRNSGRWPIVRKVVITSSADANWDILQVSSRVNWLSAAIESDLEQKPGVRFLEITIAEPPNDLGEVVEGDVEVTTSCADLPTIRIPVTVEWMAMKTSP
jgi:hypothetical protein